MRKTFLELRLCWIDDSIKSLKRERLMWWAISVVNAIGAGWAAVLGNGWLAVLCVGMTVHSQFRAARLTECVYEAADLYRVVYAEWEVA